MSGKTPDLNRWGPGRKESGPSGPAMPPAVRRLYEAAQGQIVAVEKRNQAWNHVDKKGGTYSSYIYSPGSDPFLAYAQSARQVSARYVQVSHLAEQFEDVKEVGAWEIFSKPIRGTSLFDAEWLPWPLSTDDLNKINSIVRHNRLFARLREDQKVSGNVALLLPSQAVARTQFLDRRKNREIPKGLKPLSDRMSGYLDYYLPFIDNQAVSKSEMNNFVINATEVGIHLFQALGCYIPARLGLTPSSAIKLFDQAGDNLIRGSRGVLTDVMTKEAKEAFRPDALPDELNRYQHYNAGIDKQVAPQLQEYFANNSPRTSGNSEPENIWERLGLYKKSLVGDVKAAGMDLRFRLPDHRAIGEVIVTSQYPQTLMFVLLMRRGNGHLVVEVSDANKVYGIPKALKKENPHITDLIMTDVVASILDQTEQRHPEVAIELEEKRKRQRRWNPPPAPPPVIVASTADQITIDHRAIKGAVRQARRGSRLSRLASVIPQFIPKSSPGLPEQPVERKPLFKVEHTRSQIEADLGRNTPTKVLDQIMDGIKDLELGDRQVSRLPGEDRFVLELGRHQVVLVKTDQGSLAVDEVTKLSRR